MKTPTSRVLAAMFLAAVAWLLLAGATAPRVSVQQPDKLVILSPNDVKGQTDPCG